MRGPSPRTGLARSLRRRETETERKLWSRLRNRQLGGFKFVRQEPIGRYVADFVRRECRIVVELDGSGHAESVHDAVRDAFLASNGYHVLRFWNPEVASNLDGVIETIVAALQSEPALDPA